MKVAIMQPYFFPYLGYFSLIKHSDQFILFDTTQFIRHGWIERNRILKSDGEPMYIKISLKKYSSTTKINNIRIDNSINWKDKILAQLVSYKNKAPNYFKVVNLMKDIFQHETESIVEFNFISLKKICDYLNIFTPIKIWSEMNVKIEDVNAPDEWALNISKALKAKTYYNLPGGLDFFDRSKFVNEKINLIFMETRSTEYRQLTNKFIPFLSIIDVLMFNSKEDILKMLNNYELM